MNPNAACTPERQIPVFETLLEELDKRAAVLNETSYQISDGINRIWDSFNGRNQTTQNV